MENVSQPNKAAASMPHASQLSLLDLTTRIVVAHVGNNQTATEALPDFIKSVYRALSTAGALVVVAPAQDAAPTPAVPVKKSVFPDYIICLEDGEKLKMLKRHLRSSYDMTPADYRQKWALPADYPMVAPNYAAKRSELAKANGLGRNISSGPRMTIGPARRAKGSRG